MQGPSSRLINPSEASVTDEVPDITASSRLKETNPALKAAITYCRVER